MANKKASEESAASTLAGAEFWAGVQSGGDVKITAAQLLALITPVPTTGSSLSNIVWTGGTPPSGTLTVYWSWARFGSYVFFEIALDYSVAGSSNTQVTFDMPSGIPAPKSIGIAGASNIHHVFAANVSGAGQIGVSRGAIRRDTGNTKWELTAQPSSTANARIVNMAGFYEVA